MSKNPPKWFLEASRDFPDSMVWIPKDHVISEAEMTERTSAGWRLIDQKNNKSPTASCSYGRHWFKNA